VTIASETSGPPAARWLRPAAWLSTGLALGLLFHRYALLPLGTRSKLIDSLLWIALGLLVASRAIWRRLGGVARAETTPLGTVSVTPLVVAAAGALAAVGLGFLFVPPLGYLPLHARALPGFEVDLPYGDESLEEGSSYASGHLIVKDPAGIPAIAQVLWSSNRVDDATMNGFLEGLPALLHTPVQDVRRNVLLLMPHGSTSRSAVARVKDADLWMTLVPCGARGLVVMTMSEHWSVDRLHERIAASLRCHPDPNKDGLEAVPVILQLVPGWFRFSAATNHVQLTNGPELLLVQSVLGDVAEQAVEAAKARDLFAGVQIGARQGDRWPIQLRQVDGLQRGWLRSLPCATRHVTLLAWWVASDHGSHEGQKILDSARCRGKDEPAQVWPELMAPRDSPP
jgi:hypothetical protein